jgi:hypothetical protein
MAFNKTFAPLNRSLRKTKSPAPEALKSQTSQKTNKAASRYLSVSYAGSSGVLPSQCRYFSKVGEEKTPATR